MEDIFSALDSGERVEFRDFEFSSVADVLQSYAMLKNFVLCVEWDSDASYWVIYRLIDVV